MDHYVRPNLITLHSSLRKDGRPKRTRISSEQWKAAAATIDFEDILEKEVVLAMAESKNQALAAQRVGLSYSEFAKHALKIRRKYNF